MDQKGGEKGDNQPPIKVDTDVSLLPIPKMVIDLVRDVWGIKHLHPPQAEALPPIIAGTNTLVAVPTASGKTLVAYLGILSRLLLDDDEGKAVYLVPLKAMATEKVSELKEVENATGLKVAVAIGDREGEVGDLENARIIVATNEKFDSLLRQRKESLSNLKIVVVDEFHLLNDVSRGPTLEMNIGWIRHRSPKAQIICLSATVGNAEEMADWLGSELVMSEWRPVTLTQSTIVDAEVEPRLIQSGEAIPPKLPPPRILDGPQKDPVRASLLDIWKENGQQLVFVSTRRSAVSVARKLGEKMVKVLNEEEPERARKLAALAIELIASEESTSVGDTLVTAVKGGVAFHHAGLTSRQRRLVEDAFKSRLLLCICATPTLAAGVNLPARRVIVRDLRRWDGEGSGALPIMEVKQMMGRAGRPGYDETGEAWLKCSGHEVADDIAEHYIHGEPESVTSKLLLDPPLRMHLLSSIATGGLRRRATIDSFFSETFLGHTTPEWKMTERLDEMLNWLVSEGFLDRVGQEEKSSEAPASDASQSQWDDELPEWVVATKQRNDGVTAQRSNKETPPSLGFTRADEFSSTGMPDLHFQESPNEAYQATPMGELVAHLYLDPLTGRSLLVGLRRAVRRLVRGEEEAPVTAFGLLHLIASTPDFFPFWPRQADLEPLGAVLAVEEAGLLHDHPFEEDEITAVKGANVLQRWCDEEELRAIHDQTGVAPGDLRQRVDLAEWLFYSSRRLLLADETLPDSAAEEITQLASTLDDLRRRITQGVKEELLALTRLRNVGRKRARDLFKMNIENPVDLANAPKKVLSRLAALHGWSDKLVDGMVGQVKSMRQPIPNEVPKKTRRDDEPLPGEVNK